MKKIILAILLTSIVMLLNACGDRCREYSDFSCKEIENADYNVWFYFDKNGDGYNLGYAKGLSQCGSIARNYAANKGLTYDWSYVCCMKAKGSECYEKHR